MLNILQRWFNGKIKLQFIHRSNGIINDGIYRALYQGGDIFIMDDPLSALDMKVGKHIFDRWIKLFFIIFCSFIIRSLTGLFKIFTNIFDHINDELIIMSLVYLYYSCICCYLQHKTRILVTHQLQYLDKVDLIISMKNVCYRFVLGMHK